MVKQISICLFKVARLEDRTFAQRACSASLKATEPVERMPDPIPEEPSTAGTMSTQPCCARIQDRPSLGLDSLNNNVGLLPTLCPIK